MMLNKLNRLTGDDVAAQNGVAVVANARGIVSGSPAGDVDLGLCWMAGVII